MICYVVCLKAAIAEGEFSVERRRLELKPQGGKVQAGEFQFAVPVLPMAPEDAQGENCSNKSLFGPPCLERDIGEGSLPHVLQPFRGMFLYGLKGLAPCSLSSAAWQNSISRAMLPLSSLFQKAEKAWRNAYTSASPCSVINAFQRF